MIVGTLRPLGLFTATVCGGMYVGMGLAGMTCMAMGMSNSKIWSTHPQCADFQKFGLGGNPVARQRPAAAGPVPAQKIGLLEFDTFNQSDVSDWLTGYGGTVPLAGLSQVAVNGGVATPGAGESEVLLDIDTVMLYDSLPQTSYVVYDAPPSTSFAQMFQAMIAGGDTVISNSWAQCEDQTSLADAQGIDSVLAQAAAAGISVYNGSGDQGSSCLDGSPNTVAVPADSPHATAVGGSSATPGPGLTYGTERWWDGTQQTPSSGQGGFGVSRYFSRPSYQAGHTGSAMRSVPDVVTNADPAQGLQICQADAGGCPSGGSWGGTSMATPVWAAMTAVLNEATGNRLGEANPALYPLAGSAAFHSASTLQSDFAHVGLGSFDFRATAPGHRRDHPGRRQRVDLARRRSRAQRHQPRPGAGRRERHGHRPGDAARRRRRAAQRSDRLTERAGIERRDLGRQRALRRRRRGHLHGDRPDGRERHLHRRGRRRHARQPAEPRLRHAGGGGRHHRGQPLPGPQRRNSGGDDHRLPAGRARPARAGQDGIAGPERPRVDHSRIHTGHDGGQRDRHVQCPRHLDRGGVVLRHRRQRREPARPGIATINFQPAGPSNCGNAVPTGTAGHSVSPFASGFSVEQHQVITFRDGVTVTAGGCRGAMTPAFDPSGNIYVPDQDTGQIYVFGPGGGSADSGTALPGTTFEPNVLGGIAFGKHGELWAGLSSNTSGATKLVQLDPSTGAIQRVVTNITTNAQGKGHCPTWTAVDPLSGDVFVGDECGGAYNSGVIERIVDPAGATPAVSDYIDIGGTPCGMTFAPDGTLYVAECANDNVLSITGTDKGAPSVTTVTNVGGVVFGIGVAGTTVQGSATSLYLTTLDGNVHLIDLTQHPATVTTIASGGGLLWAGTTGPDGCFYIGDSDQLLKLGGGACQASAPSAQIALSASPASPRSTGTQVTYTAQLTGFSAAAGTPVTFRINGPNAQAQLVHAGAGGTATFTMTGILTGRDTVTASAENGPKAVISAPVRVQWVAGKDVTSLDLNQSQQSGPINSAATLSAILSDISATPATPVPGATVTLGVGGRTCTVTTNAAGLARCSLTPTATGLLTQTAAYGGDAGHTASNSSDLFHATSPLVSVPPPPPGAPVNTAPPAVSGTPTPGHTLTCSTGTWSNSPTGFGYQWNRGGRPLGGATSARYAVQILDEAQTLTCTVTASNAAGSGLPATSAGVVVAIRGTLRCPKPSGSLHGRSLGPLRIGMTRARARHALPRFGVTRNNFDNFCLFAGWGIRVGYPSAKLLGHLSRRTRGQVKGRIVLALTANPFYALRRATPGMRLSAVKHRLRLGEPLHIGANSWYVIRAGKASGVLKVRGGLIQEIGIADRRLGTGRRAQSRLLRSFNNVRA